MTLTEYTINDHLIGLIKGATAAGRNGGITFIETVASDDAESADPVEPAEDDDAVAHAAGGGGDLGEQEARGE